MSDQAFNFRQLAKYIKPSAGNDLNRFLESVPEHVGKAALIAAGIAWASAAGLGLYTMIQTTELAKIKADIAEKEAVKPNIPHIKKKDVNKAELESFVKNIKHVYTGLEFRVNKNKVTIISKSLETSYPQFRDAIGHIANAKRGWIASIESLCVGGGCRANKLAATISLKTVIIE